MQIYGWPSRVTLKDSDYLLCKFMQYYFKKSQPEAPDLITQKQYLRMVLRPVLTEMDQERSKIWGQKDKKVTFKQRSTEICS